jgi:hypothetical protein
MSVHGGFVFLRSRPAVGRVQEILDGAACLLSCDHGQSDTAFGKPFGGIMDYFVVIVYSLRKLIILAYVDRFTPFP